MNVDLNLVEKLVQKVMEQVDANQELTTAGDWGIFATMDEAINAAEAAQRKYMSCSMADRAKFIQVIRDVALKKENLEYMSRATVEETGMGVVEDKVIKNHYASEYIYNAYKDTKTCGIIEEDKSFGIMSNKKLHKFVQSFL